MEFEVYDQNGKVVKKVELPKEIFGVKINPDLIHQVVVSQMANQRQGTAHTKTRAEVSGGGRKPWPQKHMGRARHGSIRSPIWRHGGVAHGPRKERIFKKKIPKKMRRKALFMVLSGKARDKELILLDKIEISKGKTKEVSEILKNFKLKGKKILIATPRYDQKLFLAARNLPGVKVIEARELNPLILLSFKYLFLPLESIETIKQTFLK